MFMMYLKVSYCCSVLKSADNAVNLISNRKNQAESVSKKKTEKQENTFTPHIIGKLCEDLE
jgi:hypothetical protein